jgi:hypothetical protein
MSDGRRASRVTLLDQPQETRFFLIIAGWAAALGAIYWIVSGEVAGTALLAGLALAAGAMAVWLIRGRPPALRTGSRRGDGRTSSLESPGVAPSEPDTSGGGTAGIDRPFHDESGRIPDATLAPFAFGLGVALIALGPVFGLAPVAVGVVPLVWGASGWLGDARAELDETEFEDGLPGA